MAEEYWYITMHYHSSYGTANGMASRAINENPALYVAKMNAAALGVLEEGRSAYIHHLVCAGEISKEVYEQLDSIAYGSAEYMAPKTP